ncbi:hypothetical protein OTU49_004178 [Cherax quadricarinatus]|uniref:Uncharacterized protein n=1 Tax=Cherax quadricarinatus TaxID=27406 RepID=A0AAW0WZ89_CHEQU
MKQKQSQLKDSLDIMEELISQDEWLISEIDLVSQDVELIREAELEGDRESAGLAGVPCLCCDYQLTPEGLVQLGADLVDVAVHMLNVAVEFTPRGEELSSPDTELQELVDELMYRIVELLNLVRVLVEFVGDMMDPTDEALTSVTDSLEHVRDLLDLMGEIDLMGELPSEIDLITRDVKIAFEEGSAGDTELAGLAGLQCLCCELEGDPMDDLLEPLFEMDSDRRGDFLDLMGEFPSEIDVVSRDVKMVCEEGLEDDTEVGGLTGVHCLCCEVHFLTRKSDTG